jgi:hypothetical protein
VPLISSPLSFMIENLFSETELMIKVLKQYSYKPVLQGFFPQSVNLRMTFNSKSTKLKINKFNLPGLTLQNY